MSERVIRIRGIDPLLFRDGRPFASEAGALSAQSLPLPLPGTLAGMIRTRWGNLQPGWNWAQQWQEAQSFSVAGPILLRNMHPVFAAPADAVIYDHEIGTDARGESLTECRVMALRPDRAQTDHCDLPEGLWPLCVTEDIKPASGYNYWNWSKLNTWLLSATGRSFPVPDRITGPQHEERAHVKIAADKTLPDGTIKKGGVAEEGKLFTTSSLSFARYPRWSAHGMGVSTPAADTEASLIARMPCLNKEAPLRFRSGTAQAAEVWELLARVGQSDDLTGAAPFGGERRLASIEAAAEDAWPLCPEPLAKALTKSLYVRLLLATPALFRNGWKPGWLDTQNIGSPPGMSGITLQLVSAAVKRREPVSGWDYSLNKQNKRRGPKPVRWMVPAGSVYFFQVTAGQADVLAIQGWLAPISDEEQDRRDGYGLALWGVWQTEDQFRNTDEN